MLELSALILSATINLLLGLFVYYKNSRSLTHRLFCFFCFALASWATISYFSIHPVGLPQLWWARLVLLSAALLCLSVYLAFSVFPTHHPGRYRRTSYIAIGLTVVVMGLTLSPYVFSGLVGQGRDISPVVRPGIGLFMLQSVGLLSIAVGLMIKRFKQARGRERQQIKFVLAGLILSFALIIMSNLLAVILLRTTQLVTFGASLTLIFSASTGYAIVRHRLLDIRAVVARSVAYVLLLLSLVSLYGAAVFGLSAIFLPGQVTSSTQQILNIVLAIVLVLTFQPLRRFFEKLTDRVFYRDRYDSQVVLNDLTRILASEIVLARLIDRSLQALCSSLHIGYGQLFVFDHERIYQVAHQGSLPARLPVMAELQKLHRPLLVADELEGGESKAILETHGLRISLALRTKDERVGLLLLGDKLSGDIYSSQDISLLQILSGELAVAIANAKAYEQIARFNVTLQEKIRAATQDLRTANLHLKELDQAKDEFISMASHQLRTPLTTIKGYLSMLLEGDAGKLAPTQQEFLDLAFTSTERMVGLIADLLNVSRMTSGKFVLERTPTDLVKVVTEEVQQLQSHAQSKQLKLEFKPPTGPFPHISIDEGKTRQVIMNFIDNAIYYTPKGSVTVTLQHDPQRVRLSVRDTGIGVPPAARDKLFAKFYRADNAQAVRPDGTGLGLYLAKRVVEDQGGQIIFASTEGKGSTFGFELPIKTAPDNKEPVSMSTEPKAQGKS